MFRFNGIPLSNPSGYIPYIGSKRPLAPKILRAILTHHPKATHFYDLFGGGGAMSFYAATNIPQFKTIHYNDIDPHIVTFITTLHRWFSGQTDPFTRRSDTPLPHEFYQWQTRDDFNTHKNSSTYLGGLLRSVWSFAGTPAYLYADDIVEYKRILFQFLVSGTDVDELESYIGLKIPTWIFQKSIDQRRLQFIRFTRNHAHRLLAHFAPLSLNYIQQIHPLERLRHIGQCQSILKFSSITNLSYSDVLIPDNPETLIYADPPYIGTGIGAYRFGSETFNYDNFYNWCRHSKSPIYISGYETPPGFITLCEFPVQVSVASHHYNKDNRTRLSRVEKLFCNRHRL